MEIMMIDIASLRPIRLGVYSHDIDMWPRIDELAANGVRFDAVYVANAP